MKNIRFFFAILLLGSLAVSLSTCGSSSSGGEGGAASSSSATLSSISVSPAIPVGSTQKFVATGAYSDGTGQFITPLINWSSSNTSVATLDSSGRATALAAGTTTITASLGSFSGTTTLTVTPATLSSITVTPASPHIPAEVNQQFTALGTYSDGTKHDITPQVTWTSSNTGAATIISNSGLATSAAAGTTTITASLGSFSANTVLTVTPATLSSVSITPANPSLPLESTGQFAATGIFSDGTSHDLTPQVTWSSSNASVASVGSSGLATSVAAGTTTITATIPATLGNILPVSTTLTVTSAALSSIAVIPSIPVGATQQFVATATNTDGSKADITELVSWTSSAPAVATINNSALATAIAAGESVLMATTESNFFPYLVVNLSGSTTLLVTP